MEQDGLNEMPKYMVLYHANPSAWPSDPKQLLTIWEGVAAGADNHLKTGVLKEVGWFTNVDGYGIFEAESKDKVVEMVTPFFPLFSQEIHEIVPYEKGKEAILAGARKAAGSR